MLYLGIYLLAPYIAEFYDNAELTAVIRVLSLTLVISGLKNIQQAYVSRNMLFKRFFYATLGGTVGAAFIGIIIAYMGGGVWALVAQQVFNATVDTVILWITVKWRPQRTFSFQRLRGLFSYGWKLLLSGLIDTIYNDARQLIIGKMYSASDLAYYNRGKQFPNLIVSNVDASIDSVLLSAMSNAQDSRDIVRLMTRKAIKISTYVMAPLMIGLAVTADTIVRLVLTDKWLECVPLLQIFCITFMFYPIHTANLDAIKAVGRSDLFLKLEIVKKCIDMILLLSSMWFGVMAMAYSMLIGSIVSQIINSWPNKKLLNYSYMDQLKDILPSILLSVVMGISVWSILGLNLSAVCSFCLQILLGIVIYIAGSMIFKIDSFRELMDIIKSVLKNVFDKE